MRKKTTGGVARVLIVQSVRDAGQSTASASRSLATERVTLNPSYRMTPAGMRSGYRVAITSPVHDSKLCVVPVTFRDFDAVGTKLPLLGEGKSRWSL